MKRRARDLIAGYLLRYGGSKWGGVVWDHVVPASFALFVAFIIYSVFDRTPARTFIVDPAIGASGYVDPIPAMAGQDATVHWHIEWQRNCDDVDLFQEILIQTKTSAPEIIRLHKINVQSRAQSVRPLGERRREWISRTFYIPAAANICTEQRCEPVKASYRATLYDRCNWLHKNGFPIITESPLVSFMIQPAKPAK